METIRYTNPKKPGEIAFRYCMYPITCMILIEFFVMVTLLDHLSIKQFVLYAFPEVLSYIVIPVFILTFGTEEVGLFQSNISMTTKLYTCVTTIGFFVENKGRFL